jgi:hypothetical protein
MNAQEREWRALEAERLKNDGTLNLAMEQVEQRAIEDMLKCQFWQHRKRAALAERVKAVRALRQELLMMVETGRSTSNRGSVY